MADRLLLTGRIGSLDNVLLPLRGGFLAPLVIALVRRARSGRPA